MTQSVLDSGQGLANARVVHHPAIFERDVKVHAHENVVIVQREIADGELGHFPSYRLLIEAPAEQDDDEKPDYRPLLTR